MQALLKGNWRKAYDYLASVSSWSLLPNKTEVLDMLKGKLQECGLRTYLLSYGSFYRSLSQQQLCEMFDLPEKQARPSLQPPNSTAAWPRAMLAITPSF